MKTTKTKKATWLGRAGETYSILLTNKSTGLRVNIHRWLDDNTLEIRKIDGDGRKHGFTELKKVTLSNPNQSQIDEVITSMITKMVF